MCNLIIHKSFNSPDIKLLKRLLWETSDVTGKLLVDN